MIGQAKKTQPQKSVRGSFSPNLDPSDSAAGAASSVVGPLSTTARAGKNFGELSNASKQPAIAGATSTTHVKATSSCAIIMPGKRSADCMGGALSSRKIHDAPAAAVSARPSDIRPASKNEAEGHKSAAAPTHVSKQVKTVQIKAPNLTLCTERRESKGMLKTAKVEAEGEESTRDASEGVRVERLKGKLKELAGGQALGKAKKSLGLTTASAKENEKTKKTVYEKHSLLFPVAASAAANATAGPEKPPKAKAKGNETHFSPARESFGLGKTMLKSDDLIREAPQKVNKNLWKSVTGAELHKEALAREEGETSAAAAGIKVRMEMMRMKLGMLKNRLRRVLRNCPKMVDYLLQHLGKLG